MGFFSGLCFICLSVMHCICLYICLSIFYLHSFLVYVLGVPQCPQCFSKCNQCYQEFSTDMNVKRRRYFLCLFYSVSSQQHQWWCGGGVPTVLYASAVLGPNSRFGIRIRSIVFPCTFSIPLTSVQSQLYSHVHRQSH